MSENMKCKDCKNFREQKESEKKNHEESVYGTCAINNSVCNPGDECMTGLFDKVGAI